MNRTLRVFLLAAMLLLPALALTAIDFGVFGGASGKPGKLVIGGSMRTAMLIPFTRLEFEASRGFDPSHTVLTVSVQVTGKLGHFAPYALIGAGTSFERLNLRFSEYRTLTFFGGGIHLYLIEYLSLRGDLRFIRLAGENSTRLCAGLFLHL